jgi:hypothetical protein
VTIAGFPQPDQLAQELRYVLKAGTRPAAVVLLLVKVPGLVQVSDLPAGDWEQAIAICKAVENATQQLGSGDYGIAARTLFGVESSTRGLLLGRRRLEASRLLQVEPSTIARHWEPRIRKDVAVEIFSARIILRRSYPQ